MRRINVGGPSPVGSTKRPRWHSRSALLATAAVVALAAGVAVGPASATAAQDCTAAHPGGPVFVTPDCIDQAYSKPVIDSAQDLTTPVVHHRVSGHFEGTNIQFNIYLPPANQWQGRFFQYTYPTAFTPEEDTAKATDRALGFAFSSGGYAVQAGNASVSTGYRHDAAAAKFAEGVAADYYHSGNRKIYGYLYGPSGGSYQTTGAAENTSGVWEGFVPFVQGVPMSAPSSFFIRAMARLVLEEKADQIANALRPGGSGNPYEGLNQAQRAMLKELTAFGVPIQAWENPDYLLGVSAPDGLLGFGAIVRAIDPTYVNDFWSKPGYLGTEQSPLGDVVRAALAKVGDTPDNRWDIAIRSYYRHQVPAASDQYYGFDQFRNEDGTPRYPQRSLLVGPLVFSSVSGGADYKGHINGKMIVVDNLYDVDALPWHADWYSKRVKAALGATAFAQNYRLYYNDHADHLEAPVTGVRATYLVDYYGLVEQALRDLSAWVETGKPPADTTRYEVRSAQILVPDNAAVRRGIQPTVDLTVRGGASADAGIGQRVLLTAKAQTPPGGGKIVATEWDCDGDGSYTPVSVSVPKSTLRVSSVCSYSKPGTYYPALKVTSERDGKLGPFARVQNLDRVRVVVHP
jgi:hypothetical protein